MLLQIKLYFAYKLHDTLNKHYINTKIQIRKFDACYLNKKRNPIQICVPFDTNLKKRRKNTILCENASEYTSRNSRNSGEPVWKLSFVAISYGGELDHRWVSPPHPSSVARFKRDTRRGIVARRTIDRYLSTNSSPFRKNICRFRTRAFAPRATIRGPRRIILRENGPTPADDSYLIGR